MKPRPPEQTPNAQLKTIMNQIAAAQSSDHAKFKPPHPPQVFPSDELPAIEDAVPEIQSPVPVGPQPGSIVQAVDPKDQNYGTCYTVGGVSGSLVHGYFIGPGRVKVFLTLDASQIVIIGPAKVLAKATTSPDWKL